METLIKVKGNYLCVSSVSIPCCLLRNHRHSRPPHSHTHRSRHTSSITKMSSQILLIPKSRFPPAIPLSGIYWIIRQHEIIEITKKKSERFRREKHQYCTYILYENSIITLYIGKQKCYYVDLELLKPLSLPDPAPGIRS